MKSIISLAVLNVVSLLPCDAEKVEKPNVLLIIADDASRTSFGAYGNQYVQTPNFDRMARNGVMFTNAYNCNPKCAPARASLLTGRYSWQLEEACNHNPILSDKWEFYPYILENSGYFTGFTGKGWGPGVYKGIVQSFSSDEKGNPAGFNSYNKIKLKPPYSGISNIDYAANFEDFLHKKPDGQPFCFWLGTKEPHRVYEKDSYKKAGKALDGIKVQGFLPDNEVIRGDLADYSLEVEWFDKQLGKSIKLLEDKGLLDNTLIIITSDHGMPFPRVKGQVYEEAFHVPLVVCWGKKVKAGSVISDFISFPDIAPTILEAAGIDRHKQMIGKSFLKILRSEKDGRVDKARDHVLLGKERHDLGRTDGELLSVSYPARAIRTDKYLYVRNFKPERWPVGDPEYGFLNCDDSPSKTYIMAQENNPTESYYFNLCFGKRPSEELYDIENDPDCLHNLSSEAKFVGIKDKLWKQMQKELKDQQDPRILGEGDIFDFYPNASVDKAREIYKSKFYDPVERFQNEYPQLNKTK